MIVVGSSPTMTKKTESGPYLELLRYPVIVASVLAGVIFAKWFLALDLSRITEVGPSGIKLQETREEASVAISELEARLDETVARLSGVEEQIETSGVVRKKMVSEVSESSDAVARLSRAITDGDGTLLEGKKGYIWIGNYRADTEGWERQNLLQVDSRLPIERPPPRLAKGSQYRLAINTILRDRIPPNNDEYFRARKNLGVVPRGTLLTLVGEPVGIEREFAEQFWAEIEVAE